MVKPSVPLLGWPTLRCYGARGGDYWPARRPRPDSLAVGLRLGEIRPPRTASMDGACKTLNSDTQSCSSRHTRAARRRRRRARHNAQSDELVSSDPMSLQICRRWPQATRRLWMRSYSASWPPLPHDLRLVRVVEHTPRGLVGRIVFGADLDVAYQRRCPPQPTEQGVRAARTLGGTADHEPRVE